MACRVVLEGPGPIVSVDFWLFGLGVASALAATTIWNAARRSAERKARKHAIAPDAGHTTSELKRSLRSCAGAFLGVALFSCRPRMP
jgi:hypothetical protein